MGSPVTFRASDLARAVKVFLDAGLPVRGAEITRDGRIVVLSGERPAGLTPAEPAGEGAALSPLEAWELKRGHRRA